MANENPPIPKTKANQPGHPDRNGPDSELAIDPHTGEKRERGSHVRVANHHGAPIGLPPLVKHDEKRDMMITAHAEKHLNPGENNVDAEHWAAVKDTSPVREFLAEGLISEVHGGDTSEPEGKSRSGIADMNESKAVKAIDSMTDQVELAQLAQHDKRPAVAQAAARKIESLGVKR